MIKILHIIPNLRKGGAERLAIDIVRSFSKLENVEIILVIFKNEVDFYIEDIKEFIKVIPASVKLSIRKKNMIEVSALQLFLEEFRPNIIHTHLFEAEIVSRSCNYTKAKWFTHIHDNMFQLENLSIKTLSNKNNITNWFEKNYLFKRYKRNGGTHFIAISNHSQKYINQIQSSYKCSLLHNAIDVKSFKNIDLNSKLDNYLFKFKDVVESKYPIITLINIGSFVKKKNQLLLVEIISELKNKGVIVNCYFLGDGILKTYCIDKSVELGVSEQCFFVGNVNNVNDYLSKSDIYVHTATYEPLGLVLIEAMAAGLPIISADGGGNVDLLDKDTGYLCKLDKYDFCNRIIELIEDTDKYCSISAYNYTKSNQFDIINYISKLLVIYTS